MSPFVSFLFHPFLSFAFRLMLNHSWFKLLLLAVWITTCSTLSLTWPPPNYSLPISSAIEIQWKLNGDAPAGSVPGDVTIYLTTNTTLSSYVNVMATGVLDTSEGQVVYPPSSLQPGTYYIFLNDTNPLETNDVGGPYTFVKPQVSTSTTSTASNTTPTNSGWTSSLPTFMIPVIIFLVLLKVSLIVFSIRRRARLAATGGLLCCGILGGRRKQTVVYETHYVVYHTEEGSQTRMIGHPPVSLAPYPRIYETPYIPEYPSRHSTHTVVQPPTHQAPYTSEYPSRYAAETVVHPPTNTSEQPPEYRQSKYY